MTYDVGTEFLFDCPIVASPAALDLYVTSSPDICALDLTNTTFTDSPI